MEKFEYIPKGVCSTKMIFEIDNNVIKNIKIIGGCMGNSIGITNLCKNENIDNIINKLENIQCGNRNTSCPDQIARALKEYKKR